MAYLKSAESGIPTTEFNSDIISDVKLKNKDGEKMLAMGRQGVKKGKILSQ